MCAAALSFQGISRKRTRPGKEWGLSCLPQCICHAPWCFIGGTAVLTLARCLQPLAMDWREKIKAAKGRPADAPKAAAPKAQPLKYTSKPDLEALSGGLPPGWKALWDKQSGEVYYGNPTTKVRKAGCCQQASVEAGMYAMTNTLLDRRLSERGGLFDCQPQNHELPVHAVSDRCLTKLPFCIALTPQSPSQCTG